MASHLLDRDRRLLSHTRPDPFGSLPAANPDRPASTSDVDFADVFGGPPRRASMHELRRGRADSLDSGARREAPVFGEAGSPVSRRRHLKDDDFYSDIFQSSGGESGCSSPTARRGERDPWGSPTPSSRVTSPTRPLLPVRGEAVTGGSSLPASVSHSMKWVKATDYPMSSPTQHAMFKNDDIAPDTLPSSPTPSMPAYITRTSAARDDLIIDGHTPYRQSPLSRHSSHSFNRSSEVNDSASIKSQSRKDSTSFEDYSSKGQFHYSIYKWAGKGVTLVMRAKSNLPQESRFRRLPEIVVQEVDVIPHKDDKRTTDPTDKSQNYTLEDYVEDVTVDTKVAADETKKHDKKNLQQMFDNDLDKQQNEKMLRQVDGIKDFNRGETCVHANISTKQQAGREKNSVKVASPNNWDAAVSSEEKVLGSRVKGKVKDFIKIFNQEGSAKRKSTFETLVHSSRDKDEKGTAQGQVCLSPEKTDEQVQSTGESRHSILSDATVSIKQNSEMADKVKYDTGFGDPLPKQEDPLRPSSDSTPGIPDDSVHNMKDSHLENVEDYLEEPLFEDQSIHLKSSSDHDQIKSIDAKIREWSKGKEGNIRSLLSTLQYVLWPESGWKPVPLVDIIEGPALRRAYQKALLWLHPDKLQQKGATPHQKYIAEKVFDIMQEAWDHFNSISQMY